MEPGPLSLAPVLLSLVLALALRQVLFGLFAGVLLGTALLTLIHTWGFWPACSGTSSGPS